MAFNVKKVFLLTVLFFAAVLAFAKKPVLPWWKFPLIARNPQFILITQPVVVLPPMPVPCKTGLNHFPRFFSPIGYSRSEYEGDGIRVAREESVAPWGSGYSERVDTPTRAESFWVARVNTPFGIFFQEKRRVENLIGDNGQGLMELAGFLQSKGMNAQVVSSPFAGVLVQTTRSNLLFSFSINGKNVEELGNGLIGVFILPDFQGMPVKEANEFFEEKVLNGIEKFNKD